MAQPDIQRYLDGIESQHKTRPRFMAHLTAILEKIDGAHGVAKDMPRAFYIKEAVGAQLDVVGSIVGANRRFSSSLIPGLPTTLSDDVFRQLIQATVVRNQWDGTIGTFDEIWRTTLGENLNATYHDNQDMTMDIDILGDIEPVMTELILSGKFLPKPMGGQVIVNLRTESVVSASVSVRRAYIGTVSVIRMDAADT